MQSSMIVAGKRIPLPPPNHFGVKETVEGKNGRDSLHTYMRDTALAARNSFNDLELLNLKLIRLMNRAGHMSTDTLLRRLKAIEEEYERI